MRRFFFLSVRPENPRNSRGGLALHVTHHNLPTDSFNALEKLYWSETFSRKRPTLPPPPSWYIPPWDDAPVQQKRWDRVTAVFLAFFRRPFCPLLLLLLFCVSFVVFQESLLGAVSSAKNPFIPGINLSVALTGAARRAVEGEKRALLSMQVWSASLCFSFIYVYVYT